MSRGKPRPEPAPTAANGVHHAEAPSVRAPVADARSCASTYPLHQSPPCERSTSRNAVTGSSASRVPSAPKSSHRRSRSTTRAPHAAATSGTAPKGPLMAHATPRLPARSGRGCPPRVSPPATAPRPAGRRTRAADRGDGSAPKKRNCSVVPRISPASSPSASPLSPSPRGGEGRGEGWPESPSRRPTSITSATVNNVHNADNHGNRALTEHLHRHRRTSQKPERQVLAKLRVHRWAGSSGRARCHRAPMFRNHHRCRAARRCHRRAVKKLSGRGRTAVNPSTAAPTVS